VFTKGQPDNSFLLSIYNQKFYVPPSASMVSPTALITIADVMRTTDETRLRILYFKLYKRDIDLNIQRPRTTDLIQMDFKKFQNGYLARIFEEFIGLDKSPKKIRHKKQQTSDKWMVVARMSRKRQ
jgi:hypothetical protein